MANSYTKADLVDAVAAATDLKKVQAEAALGAALAISDAAGRAVALRGLLCEESRGLFSLRLFTERFCELLLGRGMFRGKRILSEASIDAMTAVHTRGIDPDGAPGVDMGYSVFVMRDAAGEGTKAPAGVFGWSGYHNTHFWIDPENDLFALFMSRAREFNFDIPRRLRAALYGVTTR